MSLVVEPAQCEQASVPDRPTRTRAKSFLVVADAGVVAAAIVVAYLVRSNQQGHDIDGALWSHVVIGMLAIPLWLGMLSHQRLYNARFVTRRAEELRRICQASLHTVLVLAATVYAGQLPISRLWLLWSASLGVTFLAVEREVARRLFVRARRKGHLLRNVVIVGTNDEGLELATMLSDDPTLGYRVVGFVSDDGAECRDDLLGTLAETIDVVRRTGAGGVIVAASATSVSVSNPLVRNLVHAGIHVELSSTLRDVAPERLTVRPLGRVPVVYLEPPRTGGWRSVAKRAFDLAVAGLALVLTLPIWFVIAVAIRLDSPGAVFFRQVRVGKDGSRFALWKFRTMVTNADDLLIDLRDNNEADGPLFKLRDDPRVTRVGRLLRKSSLDELPQLLNVLLGDMSLVGPRPALPQEMLAWDPQLHDRVRVKPGITGMWQVSGRSDSSFESYSRLDLYYVDNWSLVTDLVILAKTVPTVLLGRGAY